MTDYTFGIGEELQFNAQDTDLSHIWDFGDGSLLSTLSTPTHIYNTPGIYTITHTAKDFCGICTIAGSHSVEISLASITVRSILLDRYTANVGDIVTVFIIVQNLSPVYGTGTITLRFNADVIGTYNVTLDPGEETSLTVQQQVIRSGIIDICADNVCTALFVESNIIVKSLTTDPPISTGQAINTTITIENQGTDTTIIEEKLIRTTLTNSITAIVDERLVTLSGREIQTYTFPIDPRTLPNGTYTVCTDGICKAISVAISVSTGSINIVSSPEGAEAWLDGQNTGFTTPTILTDILAGNHSFKLTLQGYNDVLGNVTVLPGQTTYIYTTFTQTISTLGSVSISSVPSGAKIFLAPHNQPVIDQETITPRTLRDLPPGDYDILLRLQGYQDWTTTIPINAGQTTYISAALLETPILVGSINFTTAPVGAEIFLSPHNQPLIDKRVVTPRTITNLDIGDYDFKLTLQGYNNVVGTIAVYGGMTTYVYAELTTITPLIGSLSISSIPQGADIYLNNNLRPEKTPATISNLDPNTYTIKLKKIGYNDAEATVNVLPGQTTYVGLTLTITQIIMAAGFPWWAVIGLLAGTWIQGKKGMYEIDGKVPISLPPGKKAIIEQKGEMLVMPTTTIVDDKRKRLVVIPKTGKEPGEIVTYK